MDNSKLKWRELVRFFRWKYQMANGVWLKHTLPLELMDPFCLSMLIIIVFTSVKFLTNDGFMFGNF